MNEKLKAFSAKIDKAEKAPFFDKGAAIVEATYSLVLILYDQQRQIDELRQQIDALKKGETIK